MPEQWKPLSLFHFTLNVASLEASIDFYTKLFGTEPHKIEPGYANFAIAEPPLKLVLFEGGGEPGSLNHLGVVVETTEEVADTDARLRGEGVDTITQDATTCCHAVQDKTWATDPSGRAWEVYTILDDKPPADAVDEPAPVGTTACCGPEAVNVGGGQQATSCC